MKKRQRKKNLKKLLDRMGIRRIRAIKPRIEADIDPVVSALAETLDISRAAMTDLFYTLSLPCAR